MASLVVGRFQPFHRGHLEMLVEAGRKDRVVIVAIGSAQEAETERNPFSYIERVHFIEEALILTGHDLLLDRIFFMPLFDIGVGDCPDWGDYVLKQVSNLTGRRITTFVTGAETGRQTWFDNNPDIKVVEIARSNGISATGIREKITIAYEVAAARFLGSPVAKVKELDELYSPNTVKQIIERIGDIYGKNGKKSIR